MKKEKNQPKSWKLYLGLALCVPILGLIVTRDNMSRSFTRDCLNHIQEARNAKTVEVATKEMRLAIEYLNQRNLTEGSTRIMTKTTDDNIGVWYRVLKGVLDELEEVSPDATQPRKDIVLRDVRRALTNTVQWGPDGIEVYPLNTLFEIGHILSILLMLLGIGCMFWFVGEAKEYDW